MLAVDVDVFAADTTNVLVADKQHQGLCMGFVNRGSGRGVVGFVMLYSILVWSRAGMIIAYIIMIKAYTSEAQVAVFPCVYSSVAQRTWWEVSA